MLSSVFAFHSSDVLYIDIGHDMSGYGVVYCWSACILTIHSKQCGYILWKERVSIIYVYSVSDLWFDKQVKSPPRISIYMEWDPCLDISIPRSLSIPIVFGTCV